MKVLFLSAWYPNRYDAMAGLFVRKHAEAVARFCDVEVLYLHADEHIRKFEVEEQSFNRVREVCVYFPFCHNKWFKTLSRGINYFRAFHIGYKYMHRPDLVQANILTRSGFLAYRLKKRYRIPYVIVEHWSRYLPQNLTYKGFLHKKLTEYVVKKAACLMPISQTLQKAMAEQGIVHPNTKIIHNVVDDFFYRPQAEQSRTKKRILHISCFDEKAKNIKGILRAIQMVRNKRDDFDLVIVGTGVDFSMIQNFYKTLHIAPRTVQFVGEQTPQEVCNWFYKSDFFLMFSNYETAGIVIAESLVCGKPIISTPVGIVPEIINNDNGRIVAVKNENELQNQINWMLDHFQEFDTKKIKETGKKYSYEVVGQKLMEIYETATIKKCY